MTMHDMEQQFAADYRQQDISFGSKPHEKMTVEWAERLVSWLFAHDRQAFARAMLGMLDTEVPRKQRGQS